ncbi:MAG: hypothetical protein HY287_15025 [Planctomycetes bacterium]|nr:hypothetical protein [Planctomycetota bacterium]MBI3835637.1 hypothetical protein [Planctomycetota bacterium]
MYQSNLRLFGVSAHETTAGVWLSIGDCDSLPIVASPAEKGELVLRLLAGSKQGVEHPVDWEYLPRSPILGAVGVKSWSALKRITQGCGVDWSQEGYQITPWRSLGPRSMDEGIEAGKVHLPPGASALEIGRALVWAFMACDPLPGDTPKAEKPSKPKKQMRKTKRAQK